MTLVLHMLYCTEVKGIVHTIMKFYSLFICYRPVWLSFFCWSQKNILWWKLKGCTFTFIVEERNVMEVNDYKFPAFFKICTFVFNRGKKVKWLWIMWRVSKCWWLWTFSFAWTTPLRCSFSSQVARKFLLNSNQRKYSCFHFIFCGSGFSVAC